MTNPSNPLSTMLIGRKYYDFSPESAPDSLPIIIDVASGSPQFPDESMVNGFDYVPIGNQFGPVSATEIIEGIVKIASETEAILGQNTTKTITPKTLSKVLESKEFYFAQISPSASWIISHPLGKKPQVSVFLPNGELILPDIFSDENTITVVFATAQSGYILAK